MALPAAAGLLACSARAGAIPADQFGTLVRNVDDWLALVDAAEHHGVAALVHRAIERANAFDAMPAEAAERLRDAYRDSARRGLVLCCALLAAHEALAANGVAALPLKGPMLAATLYPDPALRPCSDIDILVRRAQVPAALRALGRIGYTLDSRLVRLPTSTLLAMSTEVIVRSPQGVALDLHWEVAPRGYPFRFDPELLFGHARAARVEGRELPALEPDALLVFLCMHGAKHAWSRLMWVGDVARVASAGFDAVAALGLAERCRCTPPLLLGLLLAHDLLAAPVPASILDRARAQPRIAALARTAALHLALPVGDERARYDTAFNARLAERAWDRARHYAALLAPSEAELTRLHLPASLRALYYPFRLVRLATKYTVGIR